MRAIKNVLMLLLLANSLFALGKFEPPDGRIIHGVGQDIGIDYAGYTFPQDNAFFRYGNLMPSNRPMMCSWYLNLDSFDANQTLQQAQTFFAASDQYGYIVVLLNVSLSSDRPGQAGQGYDTQVAQGAYDTQIQSLITVIKGLNRPVYLRIGGEMNGSYNGYSPTYFPLAWRRIVDKFRAANVYNVAWVYDICDCGTLDYRSFYPGDSYVDWYAENFFSTGGFTSSLTQQFVAESQSKGKPFMICEADPVGIGVTNGQSSWDAWFAQYFNFINSTYNVKAEVYIDFDWSSGQILNSYNTPSWGDCEIGDNSTVLTLWKQQVTQSKYIDTQSQSAIYSLIGYSPPPPPTPFAVNYTGPTNVTAGSPFTLNGSTSTSPNGSITSLRWAYVSGPAMPVISTAYGSTSTAVLPLPGSYVISLGITDSAGGFGLGNVNINAGGASGASNVQTFSMSLNFPAGASSARITVETADGNSSSTVCNSSPCPIQIDVGKGNYPVVKVDYLSGASLVASTNTFTLPLQ